MLDNDTKSDFVRSLEEQRILLINWIKYGINAEKMGSFLKNKKFNRIVIYGMGEIGVLLYEILKSTGVTIDYVIDKGLPLGRPGIRIYKLEELKEMQDEIDAVIVTPIYFFSDIYDDIKPLFPERVDIISVEDIVYGAYNINENGQGKKC